MYIQYVQVSLKIMLYFRNHFYYSEPQTCVASSEINNASEGLNLKLMMTIEPINWLATLGRLL